ncbi:putative tricarboxylic transport membrane protein [Anaerovirgula multivorans]|uniref:Putative tricarboxylic transport membrane protein n=1 Tax=Anaerovirgula multivorans TaxID=312168 RepID=A0A239K8Y2_9FIRM|nr:tripartite tricarboxylate transporter TctB family protein [Anaerovirgula multivorans]SNT14198.1 putative tricarboxylic transport membrane protein [Anaerovirgula multivorans]
MNYSALTGVVSIIVGLVYSIQAYTLPRAVIGKPMAPIIFPLGLGLFMILLGIVLVIQSIKKGEFARGKSTTEKGLSYTAKLIIFTCTTSIIYALLFERIGFVFSTTLFLGSLLYAINGKKEWKVNVSVAVIFSVFVYVLFSKLLGIILPPIPYLYI